MSEQMKKSICKSRAYGETAEKTAEMHECTVDEVLDIWKQSPDLIEEYKSFYSGIVGEGI